MTEIIEGGFPPSVFLRDDSPGVRAGAPSGRSSEAKKERSLIVSDRGNNIYNPIKDSHRPERTKNRKNVTTISMIERNGMEYKINNSIASGVYLKILNRALDQLDICIEKWRRVFVIRFDLHQKQHTPDNKMLSKFRDNLVRRIERHYETFEVGYVWVREQEKAKRQHYHMALYLDGDKINHPAVISEMIKDCWEAIKAGNTVYYPQNRYYNVTDENSKREAVYRLSYLSKQRGKGYRPPQTKDYSTSRLTAPPRYNFKTGGRAG